MGWNKMDAICCIVSTRLFWHPKKRISLLRCQMKEWATWLEDDSVNTWFWMAMGLRLLPVVDWCLKWLACVFHLFWSAQLLESHGIVFMKQVYGWNIQRSFKELHMKIPLNPFRKIWWQEFWKQADDSRAQFPLVFSMICIPKSLQCLWKSHPCSLRLLWKSWLMY